MNREDLAKLFRLQAAILGIGFGGVALGLGYMHYKEDCADNTQESTMSCMADIFSNEENFDPSSPQQP